MPKVPWPQADRIRHALREPLSRVPFVYDAAVLLRPSKRGDLARRDSSLVIEGFLRSGNTFAVAAFRVANGPDHHLGHHLHAAAHVRRAVRLGLPTVVVVREPSDAVASYLVRRPTLTPHAALREYICFYRSVWRVHAGFVVAPFDLVVSDFGLVVAAVNRRFGTGFAPYRPSPANDAACFRLVDEMNREECGGLVIPTHVARPTAERSHRRDELLDEIRAVRPASLLEEATRLYHRYRELASVQHAPSSDTPR